MASILLIILAALLVILVVVALVRRKSRDTPGAGPSTLLVTRFIAVVYAALMLVITAVSVIMTLVSDAVDVMIPVRQFWPEPHPWITIDQGPTASVASGGFSLAEVTVSGLGTDARLLLAAGHTLQGLTFTVIALVVAVLCHRLLSGTAFKPALSRSVSITAMVIAVGGVLWQVCYWIGGSLASAQVLTVTGWQSDDPRAADPNFDMTTGLPEPTFAMTIDFWPIFLGLALAAVAAAFRHGERLERDTEGLV
jgi:hypothetical protein